MECLKIDAFSLEGKIYLLNVFNDFHNVCSVTVWILSLFLSHVLQKKLELLMHPKRKKHYELITLHYQKFYLPPVFSQNQKN